jgi:hypothetical protein
LSSVKAPQINSGALIEKWKPILFVGLDSGTPRERGELKKGITSKRRYDLNSRFSPSEVRVISRAVTRTIGRSSDS